jgi:ribonuclease-3
MTGKKDVKGFADKLGLTFNSLELLEQAFTHRSYLNEHRDETLVHNERLEFLGDAVLELVVTRYLFEAFPTETEGDLTAYRAALVNTNTISMVASTLGMNEYLMLSRGEAKDTGRARQYILANTFESVVGAVYLDQGYDAAAKFIGDTIFPLTAEIVSKKLWQDDKSHFQEEAQERASITPTYKIVAESGPDHDKHFTVGVFLGAERIAEGEGKSKQEAEQAAAQAALQKKGW